MFKFPLDFYDACTGRATQSPIIGSNLRDDTFRFSFLFSLDLGDRGRTDDDMAAWFVVTIPTAAYEQKLLADRDKHSDAERHGDGTKVLSEVDNVTEVLALGSVQGSTLLQNRRQPDTNINPNGLSPESGSKFFFSSLVLTQFDCEICVLTIGFIYY